LILKGCVDKAMKHKIVIGVAGMPGAGKTEISRVANETGCALVFMGDVIREEANLRRLEPTPENIGSIMLKLREEEGSTVVAKKCIPKIISANADVVLVDGVRSLNEVQEFKKSSSDFSLIAVHSSPETRFKRLFRRKRSDDPNGWEIFLERDLRELCVGQGNVMVMSDYMIVNEGTLDDYKAKIREVLEAATKKWTK
jgi:dephospho-CoA kinase